MIRALIALAAKRGWKIYQLDVKSVFLNGVLEEEIYMEQPPGFISKGKEGKVLRQKKPCTVLNKLPVHGIVELISTSQIKDSGGVRVNQHYTSRLKDNTLLLSLYM